jgi:hypothetical protein
MGKEASKETLFCMTISYLKNQGRQSRFSGIWEYPHVRLSCMIIAYHNSQDFARLADQYFTFCPEYQTDGLYRYLSLLN